MASVNSNRSSRLRPAVLLLAVVVLAVLLVVPGILRRHRQQQGASAQAQFVVQQLLNCSRAIEPALDAAADAASSAAASGTEPGLVCADDSALTSWVEAQFGDIMTAECRSRLLLNRVVSRIPALAEQYGSSIEAPEVTLTRRSGDAECYDYSAPLQTVEDGTVVGTASGTITLTEEDGVWKASDLTLTLG